MSRYSILHPLISPEYYDNLPINIAVVRSLVVYSDPTHSPDLVYNTASEALRFVFDFQVEYNIVPVHTHYHMYLDDFARLKGLPENIIATRIYRHNVSTLYGIKSKQSVYGDVIFFGSLSYETKTKDGNDYSVPYELLEQSIRLHSYYAKFK